MKTKTKTPKKTGRKTAVIRWRQQDADKLARKLFDVGIKAAQKDSPHLKFLMEWDKLQSFHKAGHLATAKFMLKQLAACV